MSEKRSRSTAPGETVYQLEIVLAESKPPIWRRLRVLGDIPLHSLHLIILHAMGWSNSHLYQFEVADRRYAERDPDDDFESEEPAEDAERVTLDELGLAQGSEFLYVYDFGDWWEHRIVVEAVADPAADEPYPCCVDGARAGPLEDSGGVHGYAELLAALRDPRHPEHAEYSEWVPAGFDPDAFDAAETTELLQHYHGRKRGRGPRKR